ncbi:MAG: peptidoglycan bridge formation glycyltransferase FemA/FemB family protein [Cellulomonas sp.]|nr:peptidoglycan bridge formation glycyltransferase FemA/FemB family protein [Cellulomonas sp.]
MPSTPADFAAVVEEVTDRAAWETHVLALGGHPLQLWGWGEVKSAGNWTARRVLVRQGAAVVGAAQVLVRRLPWPLQRLSYVPRGPALAAGADRDAVTAAVVAWARIRVGGAAITLEPQWPVGTVLDVPGSRPAAQRVLVPDTLVLDLTRTQDELQSAMSKTTRKQIRRSARTELVYREVTDAELPACLAVYHEVADRAGFALHPDEYYLRVRAELGPEHSPVFAAFDGDRPVAFLWLAASDRTAFELYGGATEAGQELHANFSLKWTAICAMQARGLAEYDMNGLLNDGISTFKRSFADHEDHLVGAIDVPFGLTYRLWTVAAPAAKRVLRALQRR